MEEIKVTFTKNYDPTDESVIEVAPGVCIDKELLEDESNEEELVLGEWINIGEARKASEILKHYMFFAPPWSVSEDDKEQLADMVFKSPAMTHKVLSMLMSEIG